MELSAKQIATKLMVEQRAGELPNALLQPISAAAEALALVAWAEEQQVEMVHYYGKNWSCYSGRGKHHGTSFLGCIRAAKEAYENEK